MRYVSRRPLCEESVCADLLDLRSRARHGSAGASPRRMKLLLNSSTANAKLNARQKRPRPRSVCFRLDDRTFRSLTDSQCFLQGKGWLNWGSAKKDEAESEISQAQKEARAEYERTKAAAKEKGVEFKESVSQRSGFSVFGKC